MIHTNICYAHRDSIFIVARLGIDEFDRLDLYIFFNYEFFGQAQFRLGQVHFFCVM